eukprot:scaffold174504_cov63-Attheya_sp.AAC.5
MDKTEKRRMIGSEGEEEEGHDFNVGDCVKILWDKKRKRVNQIVMVVAIIPKSVWAKIEDKPFFSRGSPPLNIVNGMVGIMRLPKKKKNGLLGDVRNVGDVEPWVISA